MKLTKDLISQFVKVTKDETDPVKETITYGTVSQTGKEVYLDGSDIATPISKTADVGAGDRVIVMIKNHSATIIGNLTSPAMGSVEASSLIGTLVADKVQAETVVINEKLTAAEGDIKELKAENVEITDTLKAQTADIVELKANSLDAETVEAVHAAIENLDVATGYIHDLESSFGEFSELTTKNFEAVNAVIDDLDATYANIDFSNIGKAAIEQFFSKSGMIDNLVVGDSTITGELVGVTISGDLIKANTVKADKLVVKGSDGIYYKLNIAAGATTSAEVTESDLQNGLHGSAIIAKTITAEKISVNDLVAFGADIAGFHITEQNTFYSGAKSSVNNTTQGIYMDATGQMNIGDGSNFMKYYKAADGSYKLEISANSIILSSSGKSVETAINDVQKSVDDIEIGGRNLVATSYLSESTNGIKFNGKSTSEFTAKAWVGEAITPTRVKEKFESGETYTISCGIEIVELPEYTENGMHDSKVAFFIYSESTNWKYNLMLPATLIEGNSGELGAKYVLSETFVFPEIQDDTKLVMYTCLYLDPEGKPGSATTVKVTNFKIVKGKKSTIDWSPAPEDLATAEEVDKAQSTASEADTKASDAQALIAQLADSISMLVTDGNGTSLMTQTEDGWTFSTATIQDLVNKVSDNLNTLTEDVGEVNGTVDLIKQAVNDLEEIAEYVKVTTYEDEPCIELGEADSEFKLRITNTRMMFTEGSTVLAYFTNQAFNSKKVVIEEELQQGGFVWKVRSNGNLGLTWKGGNS